MDNGCVIGVAGGSGGVGASVLAAALGMRAVAAGRTAVCVDGDRLGGGLDVTLGLEQEHGLRWPDLMGVRGRVDGHDLLRRLPTVDGLAVLSFDRSSDVAPPEEAVREVLAALVTVVELVVVDLPRPDELLFGAFVGAVDGILLLGGSGVRQLAALSAVAPRLGSRCDEVWLALRSAGRDDQLADVTAGALDLPLVALVPYDPTLEADLLHGIPPGSAARTAVASAADAVLAQLLVATRAAS
jgi:secretion/DNA translocation related CpaE-like protein